MTETNRYVKATAKDKVPFVVNQAIWFEGETKFADIILPACTNFERWDIGEWANCSRLHRRQLQPVQPPGDRAAEEVHRAAGRVQVRLRDLRRAGRAAGRLRDLHHGRQDRARLGQADSSTRPTCPRSITWEEFEKKGYYVVPPPPRTASPRRRCAGSPKDRERDTPDWGPAPWDTVRAKACRRSPARSSSWPPASSGGSHRHRRPRAPGHGPAVHPELGGPPHHGALRQVPAADDLAAPAVHASTPWATPRTAGLNEVKDHRVLKATATTTGSCVSTRPDAAARGIDDGDLIRAFNDRGSVILCGPGDRAGAAGRGPLLRIVRRLRPLGDAGRVAGPRRLREHPDAQAVSSPRRPRAWRTTPA